MRNNVYLMMVTPSENHNKFYQMNVLNEDFFEVVYGRVGAKGMRRKYSMNLFESKYKEKIKKGYQDVTTLHGTSSVDERIILSDKACEDFLNYILEESNHILHKNYSVDLNQITKEMIKEAEMELSYLDPERDVIINN